MKNENNLISVEHQFGEVLDIILRHKSRASRMVNGEVLLTAWQIGSYVSAKLKSQEWGSKVVSQLSEYIRAKRPDVKGYSRRSIYNMVMFYEEYSSPAFQQTIATYMHSEIVQTTSAQFEIDAKTKNINGMEDNLIVQMTSAQLSNPEKNNYQRYYALQPYQTTSRFFVGVKVTKNVCSTFFIRIKNVLHIKKSSEALPVRPIPLC